MNTYIFSNPKVSVIIPTYNRSIMLGKAIKSVLNQDYQDVEIIVVDNASTDNTKDIVSNFRDNRIRYISHEINRGASAARNTGISQSRGDYIALLDDDDQWLPNKLRLQVNILDKSDDNVGLVYCGYTSIDKKSGKELYKKINLKDGYLFNDLLYSNLVGNSSTPLIRKKCFDKVGLFDEQYESSIEDMDMYLRISSEYLFKAVNESLVIYSKHSNSVSKNYEALVKGTERYFKKFGPYLEKNNTRKYSYRLFLLGTYYFHCDQIIQARKLFIKSIGLYPFNIRYYLHMFCTFLGSDFYSYVSKLKQKHYY